MRYADDFIEMVGADELFPATGYLNPIDKDVLRSIKVLEVGDPVALNMVIAQWREYCGGPTFFRGQNRLHGELPLSGAYRSDLHNPSIPRVLSSLLAVASGITCDWRILDGLLENPGPFGPLTNGFMDVPEYALEGLFQHYEGGTRWLDVVDNIQVALWMATRQYERVHVNEGLDVNLVSTITDTEHGDQSIYLYLFGLKNAKKVQVGLVESPCGVQLLDLREALPARFLRPHSQHSALLKFDPNPVAAGIGDESTRFATLKIPLDVALSCCGGALLNVSTLFPDRNVDKGFEQLDFLIRSKLLSAPPKHRVKLCELPPRYVDANSTEGRFLLERRTNGGRSSVPSDGDLRQHV